MTAYFSLILTTNKTLHHAKIIAPSLASYKKTRYLCSVLKINHSILRKASIMCILKKMQEFAANGARVFGKASKGQYHAESETVKEIKEEIMSGSSSRRDDTENRLRDRRNVNADIRKSLNKIILENG